MFKMFFFWSRQPMRTMARVRAGPWLAWFATATLLWRYRLRIARVLHGATLLPLRLLVERRRRPGKASGVANQALHRLQMHSADQLDVVSAEQYRKRQRRQRLSVVPLPAQSIPAVPSPSAPDLASGDHRRCHDQWRAQKLQKTVRCHQTQKQQIQRLQMRAQLMRRWGRADKNKSVLRRSRLRRLRSAGDLLTRKLDGLHISQGLFYRVTRSGRIYGKYLNLSQPSSPLTPEK